MTASSTTLTLHHLQRSQSDRIVWLLEEIGAPYNIVIHKRDPIFSPPSLRAVHEPGTAPVIEDGPLVLSESMAIATYILSKYGGERGKALVPGEQDPQWTDYLYWLYFGLNTLAPAASACMFAFFDNSISADAMVRQLTQKRFLANLAWLEKRVANSAYLAGDRFTLADIMISWPLTGARDFIPYSLEAFPEILKYLERITGRPAYLQAREKGDQGLPVLNKAKPGSHAAKF